ncbi:MAG: DnaJ domain-containing protein [bacterium]
MEQKDYYKILGIDKEATAQQIKEAYRNCALKYHPDRNKAGTDAVEKMQEINEAYAVLSHSEKRRAYDALRQECGASAYSQFRRNYSEQDIFRDSDISQIFEDIARSFGLRGFDEIFKESFNQGHHQGFEFKKQGVYVKGFVFTGWFDGFTGLKKLFFNKPDKKRLSQKGIDLYDFITLTPLQVQQGGRFPYIHRETSQKLAIQIPPGIRDGQKIRLPGMGLAGKSGGTPGDLYLKVTIKKPLIKGIKNLIGSLFDTSPPKPSPPKPS